MGWGGKIWELKEGGEGVGSLKEELGWLVDEKMDVRLMGIGMRGVLLFSILGVIYMIGIGFR